MVLRSRKAQAMVEFAFISLMFFAFIFVIMQLILITNAKIFLNLAAYSSCRDFAVSHSDTSALQRGVHFLDSVGLKGADYSFSRNGGDHFGDIIHIVASLPHKNIPIILINEFFDKETVLKAPALMPRE